MGRVSAEVLEELAAEALRAGRRAPGGEPLILAAALGFALLPCVPGSAPELERTSADRLVFAAELGAEHAERVRLALARGLLLRRGVAHDPADCAALARRL